MEENIKKLTKQNAELKEKLWESNEIHASMEQRMVNIEKHHEASVKNILEVGKAK